MKILHFTGVKYKSGLELDRITMVMVSIFQEDYLVWTIYITFSGVAGVELAGTAGKI